LKKGNVLRYQYPTEYKLPKENIEDYCFMDGAHLYSDDVSFMLFPNTNPPTYAIAIYHKYKSEKYERGAVQKAIVILNDEPWYKDYLHIGKEFLHAFIDQDNTIISENMKELYHQLNTTKATHFKWKFMNIKLSKNPSIKHIASVNELVRRFKKNIMLLWYAVLLQKRIMVVGKPAHVVGSCVIAIPELIQPMVIPNVATTVTPYVTLTDLEPIEEKVFIAGATNELFEQNKQWWDVCASFQTGSIIQQGVKIKLSKKDRQFTKSVLSGIRDGRDETWTRTQFKQYTEQILVMMGRKKKNKAVQKLKTSPIYLNHLKQPSETETQPQPTKLEKQILKINTETPEQKACALLEKIKTADDTKLPLFLFQLASQIQNLNQLTALMKKQAIPIIGNYIRHEKVQVRKYSASILSSFAVTVEGQDALISHEGIVQHIIELIQDPLPNLRYASIYCLMKISAWKKGVMLIHELSPNIVTQLMSLVLDPALDVQIVSTGSLINLLPLKVNLMETSDYMNLLSTTVNTQLKHHLIVLLDRMGVNFLPSQLPNDQTSIVESLTTLPSNEIVNLLRTMLMESIVDEVNTNTFMIELLSCDIIPILITQEKSSDLTSEQAILSCELLKFLILGTSRAIRQFLPLLPLHLLYWRQQVFSNILSTQFENIESEEDHFDVPLCPPDSYLVSIVEILTHCMRYDLATVLPLFISQNFISPFLDCVLNYYQKFEISSESQILDSHSPSLHKRLRNSPLRHFASASPPSPSSPRLLQDDSDLNISMDDDSSSDSHHIQLIASIIECFSFLIEDCTPEQLTTTIQPIKNKLLNSKTFILEPLSSTILNSNNQVYINMYLRFGQILTVFLDHSS